MYGGALSIKGLATTSTVPPAPGPPWRLPEATATVQTCSVLACLQRSSRRGTRRAHTLKHANGAGSVRGSSVVVREEYCRSMLSSVRRGGVAAVWRNSVPAVCLLKPSTSHHARASSAGMSSGTPRSYHFEFSAGLPSGGRRGEGPPPPESHVYPAGTWGAAPASHSAGTSFLPYQAVYMVPRVVLPLHVYPPPDDPTVLVVSDGALPRSAAMWMWTKMTIDIYISCMLVCMCVCLYVCMAAYVRSCAYVSAYQKSVRTNHRQTVRPCIFG